ncbi:hypothetical protein RI129_008274 [Pyrocoelia pectoralis]|uniref:Reverse transcriptase domain-containing protein n=1 Tax=Pyrocoelia pectoralis TaxID=417401 RepID=A0AAN7ZFX5_9COLE
MEEVIKKVRLCKGYKMGDKEFIILCYADDAVLLPESEDNLQRNKHLKIEIKSSIYKTTIRPIMTYTAGTRPDTIKTKRLLETKEMKIPRKITGKTHWTEKEVKVQEEDAK